MTLEIKYSESHDYEPFISWLLHEIVKVFIALADPKQFVRFTKYFNEIELLGPRRRVDAYNLALSAINSIIAQDTGSSYIIQIDNNRVTQDMTAKVNEVARLINFGTLSVSAYPIFDQVFDYVAENMQQYVQEFYGVDNDVDKTI